jgi:arylsulfate sulfotransferase
MAAVVEFATDRPVRVTLLLKESRSERLLATWKSFRKEYVLPVFGFRPGSTNAITIEISDQFGNASKSRPLIFIVDPLPHDFPPIQTVISQPLRMEPGTRLFDVIKSGVLTYGLLVMVNERGEVIWYYRSDKSISDFRRMANGNLLFMDTTGASEINMLGNVIQSWHPKRRDATASGSNISVNTDMFHHEIYETLSGNFLVLSTELRHLLSYPSSEKDLWGPLADSDVVGDVIVEFNRYGTILGWWDLFDVLDPYRIGFDSLGGFWNGEYAEAANGTKDWSHANAVIEDSVDDSVIVSIRHQDALVKIDRKTGKLIWILGNPDGWDLPWNRYLLSLDNDDFQWPYHQHGPMITPNGTILLFDNGNHRHRPFDHKPDENYSRAVEYAVDAKRMAVSQVWSFGAPNDELFYSDALGNANWLPITSNVLITDGARVTSGVPANRWARIVEVTHTKSAEKVFELIVKDPPGSNTPGWLVYRAIHLPSLYSDAVH